MVFYERDAPMPRLNDATHKAQSRASERSFIDHLITLHKAEELPKMVVHHAAKEFLFREPYRHARRQLVLRPLRMLRKRLVRGKWSWY